jgi:hypothetical protein
MKFNTFQYICFANIDTSMSEFKCSWQSYITKIVLVLITNIIRTRERDYSSCFVIQRAIEFVSCHVFDIPEENK